MKTPPTKRRRSQQRIHDLVIAAFANQYTARGYVVHTNPNQQKTRSVAGMYPDVVVMAKSLNRHRLIVEVETEDSVTDAEASRQWIEYDNRYGAWILAIPTHMRRTAKLLIDRGRAHQRPARDLVDRLHQPPAMTAARRS